MKKWNNPEIRELNFRGTEYGGSYPNDVDGEYKSYDGKLIGQTYSGPGPAPSGVPVGPAN